MEYIQADIWVRFQRMQGHAVHFVCADDAHGAPIMIAAEKAGKTPQQFVADIAAGRKQYLDGFHIGFDNWHRTDGAGKPRTGAGTSTATCKAAGLIATQDHRAVLRPGEEHVPARPLHQGRMPQVPRQGPVRRQLRDLRRGLCAHRPDRTRTRRCRRHAGAAAAREHFFFKLSDPRCVAFLEQWTQDGHLQPEVANKIKEWFTVRTNPDGSNSEGLGDWDISRDAPYFGIEIPDAPGKYFYVWLDAPIGYLASLKNLLGKTRRGLRRLHGRPGDSSSTTSSARTSSPSTRCSGRRMLHFSGRKTPNNVFVHGFLTVQRREDEQEPRHRPGPAASTSSLGMNPEWLRYYLAAKLNARNEDIDFNPDDFMARVNSDLIGKYINIASRAGGLHQQAL